MEKKQNIRKVGWRRSHTLILVKELQKHKCLYNPLDENFTNKPMRLEKLILIRDKLKSVKPNVTVGEIKKKIKSLRGQLWKEKHVMNLKKVRSGADAVYKPVLWCYNDLSFLLSANDEEPSQSNIDFVEVKLPDTEEYQSITDTEESNDNYLEDSGSGITSENKGKIEAKQLEECGMEAIEFMKHYFGNRPVKQPLEKEEQFCQYLCSLLKKIKFEETFEEISLQILTLVNQNISEERKQLQVTFHINPLEIHSHPH